MKAGWTCETRITVLNRCWIINLLPFWSKRRTCKRWMQVFPYHRPKEAVELANVVVLRLEILRASEWQRVVILSVVEGSASDGTLASPLPMPKRALWADKSGGSLARIVRASGWHAGSMQKPQTKKSCFSASLFKFYNLNYAGSATLATLR